MNSLTRFCWLLAIVVATCYGEKIETIRPPVEQGGKYLVYLVDQVSSEETLNISVSIFNTTGDVHVKVALRETRNKTVVATIEDNISSESTKMLAMPLPFLLNNNYLVEVNGTGALNFSDNAYIYVSHRKSDSKKHSIIIQTDKPLYKPSDSVKFRVFGIQPNLLASKAPMNISIINPKRTIMAHWTNMENKTGVISLEYELSDKPVFGTWTIEMDQENKKERHQFKVREYVLPNYKVTVESEKTLASLGHGYLFIYEDVIKVNVTAKYTFGKSVRGDLVLNATIGDSDDALRLTFEQKIEGTNHIEFKMNDFIKTNMVKVSRYQSFCTPRKIIFKAMVTEALTGKKMYSEPFTVEIVNSPIKLEIDTPIIYKSGLPSQVHMSVSRLDDKPLTEEDRKFPVSVMIKYGNGYTHRDEYDIPQNGSIKFKLLLPDYKEGPVTIEAKYTGHRGSVKYETTDTAYPRFFMNNHHDNVEATLLQERVILGDDIKVFMNSTAPISWALITIISNKKMLSNELRNMEDKTHFVLEIPTSEIMIPEASVIISCLTSNGKFMVDASIAKITIAFKNDVVGTFTEKAGKPGTNVDFKVKTMPGSAVFVMAVDKNLHLLESAKYITEDMIYDALLGSENSNRWRYSVTDINGVINSLGMEIMTNFIKKHRSISYNTLGRTAYHMESAPMGPGPIPVSSYYSPVSSSVSARIRKYFPETWIWLSGDASDAGEFSFNNVVPDSITKWTTNAFAFHPEKGLGIMKESAEFLSYQDFFIVPVLPPFIIRGESFVLKVSIFSNLTQDQEVTVTLPESDQFTLKDSENAKTVTVNAHSDNTVQFEVVPTAVGEIPVKVQASCEVAADEVHKKITVKPEGYTLYFNKAFLLKIEDGVPAEIDYEFEAKPEFVKDSERVEVSIIGDIMGPSFENLENLIRIPSGCGEQNMINFAPNVYAKNYLSARAKLTDELAKKILYYTRRGYKNQMQYQHSDGSFSAFGHRDKVGSTWLTAFVLRCFGQAHKSMPDLYIDEGVFRQGITWLLRQQNKQGYFVEYGRVIHSAMQGGTNNGLTLTIYTLISLVENKHIMPNVTDSVIRDVTANLPIMRNDTYSLGMMLYLMTLVDDTDRFEEIQTILEDKAINKDDMKYWDTEVDTESDPYSHSVSTRVELASYILMAYVNKENIEEGLPIMKYILSQRNSNGGFQSTQDTILGIEALGKFAQNIKSPTTFTVTVTSDEKDSYTFPEINSEMSTVLYTHVLPSSTKTIHIKGEGTTSEDATATYAFAQISWQYNIKLGSADKVFEGKVEYRTLSSNEMALNICHKMKKMNITGMVIIEAALPSGYMLSNKKELLASENISKVEIEETEVVLYLNKLDTSFSCHELEATKIYEVKGHTSPLPVKIRLYYQPDLELVTMYTITGGSE
uniref:Thioester-containing protein 1 n=1 Tax=Euprymna scolopes TaxID=6613 RepID=M4I0F6_EUPSC|nr:thioester-containing protein 1 [Euprymna scolopes]